MGDLNSSLGSSQETFSYINNNPDEQGFINNIDSLPVGCFMDTNSNLSGEKLSDLLNESLLITLKGKKIGDTSGKLTCHQ